LAFGGRGDSRVVLKLCKQRGDEWHAGDVLRAFNGDGTVRIYAADRGAVLLERLDPGRELVEIVREGNDATATEILADVMRRMAQHEPPEKCPTVVDWGQGFDRYLKTGDSRVPRDLVGEARESFRNLANSQRGTILLHGDLHHYNVLFDSTRGWVAIDPKGVVGEREYEVGAILRNPIEQPDLFCSGDVINRRLSILTKSLNLDYRRALKWSFAQAVLSAIWDVEDGYAVGPDVPALKLARTIRQQFGDAPNVR
jgi:streptomycin 6-kinase